MFFSLSFSFSPPLCGVTRITCFSPNGHFCWQVHYTPYFQIVFPLLMPGRLIARVWLAEKGPRCVRAPDWKTLITVFLRAWLRPLKGKILTFSPLFLLSMGPARRDGPCHQNDSINSSERPHHPALLSLFLREPWTPFWCKIWQMTLSFWLLQERTISLSIETSFSGHAKKMPLTWVYHETFILIIGYEYLWGNYNYNLPQN